MVQSPDEEDIALMLRVAAGDKAAFAKLFDRHQRSVVRFCERFVKSHAQAEELAQDVFVKLYRNASGYRPTARFKTFLFRIATNHCLNEVRRTPLPLASSSPVSDDPHAPEIDIPSATTPHETLEARELERAINMALTKMSVRERAAFTLCRFEGLSYADIALVLNATESAIKSLIHRGTVQVMRFANASNEAGSAAIGSHV